MRRSRPTLAPRRASVGARRLPSAQVTQVAQVAQAALCALMSAALGACEQPTQRQQDISDGSTLGPGGQSVTQESVAALMDLSAPAAVPCSATFIAPRQALTAAHCVRADAPPGTYQLVLQSPVTSLSVGAMVTSVIIHPLWSGNTQQVTDHVQALYQGRATTPLATESLYDLALVTIASSLPGAAQQIPGSLPNGPLSFSAISFKSTINGVERSAELLTSLNTAPTNFTVLGAGAVSSTPGGAAASVSAGSVQALLGVHAGGVAGVGSVFVRLDAHTSFINDALNGISTGDYRVSTQPTQPTQPTPPTDPTGPTPPSFDCRVTSDRFCDLVCQGDIDCTQTVMEYKSFGVPCTDSSECTSGVCLRFDTETTRCSEYCSGNTMCPVGFECRAAQSGRLVCGTPLSGGGAPPPPPPSQKYFGADCRTNNDCSTNFCVTNGGRKWCSSRCTNDASCPISYVCATVPEGKACVPPGTQTPTPPPSPPPPPPP